MRKINEIIIHCAATKPNMDIGAKEINLWHRQRGFFNLASGLSIGYHYVIRRDGTVETGRPVSEIGAHASGHNAHSIGVCLVGGIDANGKSENNFTVDQWESLLDLVKKLKKQYNVPLKNIKGHNEVAQKDCPCFSVRQWVRDYEDELESAK